MVLREELVKVGGVKEVALELEVRRFHGFSGFAEEERA